MPENINTVNMAEFELLVLKTAGKFQALASHPALHLRPEWMRELAQHNDPSVRRTLAINNALASSPAAALLLATDPEPIVRFFLAVSSVADKFPEVVERLLIDPEPDIRRYMQDRIEVVKKLSATLSPRNGLKEER